MNQPPARPENANPTVDDPVRPGDVLSGKFRVERVLGVGGMGVVAAATHLQLGQRVALKFMLPSALAYPDNVARFEREARAAVRLRSDHVAKVTDVGRLDNGAPYMVMEFLEGEDLHQYVAAHGSLPVTTAVDFVLQACEAIAEAHAQGIVHRDLKPQNLFLARRLNGEPLVKVLDFGVSKVMGGEDLSLTSTTQVLGSPSYMSPEQLRASRDVDQRTDIWAIGSILYELLTTALPFPADTLTQLTAKVISEPPVPVEAIRPDIPSELRQIILKCLEKRPEDRFQSVPELAAALAPFASAASASLATQRMSSGDVSGAAHAGAIAAPRAGPGVTGGSTDAVWDRTQLATGDKRAGRTLPAIAGAAALAILAAGVFFFARSRHAPPVETGSPRTPAATSAATTPAPPPETVPLPTVRDPLSPPVVSGVERPPPSFLVPHPLPPRTVTTQHAGARHDAGAVSPRPTAGGGFDLPNTRN